MSGFRHVAVYSYLLLLENGDYEVIPYQLQGHPEYEGLWGFHVYILDEGLYRRPYPLFSCIPRFRESRLAVDFENKFGTALLRDYPKTLPPTQLAFWDTDLLTSMQKQRFRAWWYQSHYPPDDEEG